MNKIYGNTHALECIDRAVNAGKLHHAYLLYGEKGLGKKELASYFAKTILCHGEHKPCGVCSSCHKFDSNNHPDVLWLHGDSGKNELTISRIREIKGKKTGMKQQVGYWLIFLGLIRFTTEISITHSSILPLMSE